MVVAEDRARPRASVAVITRTRNRRVLLRRTLLSVASQTYRDYVHVVVNDGGNRDDVEQALRILTDEERARVIVLHKDERGGMEAASNFGIAACESEFIVMHDDDDSWNPEFLQKSIAAIGPSNGVITHSYVVDEQIDGETITTLSKRVHAPRQVTLFKMAMESFQFPNNCFLYRRSAYEAIGGYDEKLPVMGDWDFNLRFLSRFDVELLPEPLANYHHRREKTGVYGNSVWATEDQIWRYRSILANAMLRRDLESGRVGLGLVVCLGLELREIQERLLAFHVANPFLIRMMAFFRKFGAPFREQKPLNEFIDRRLKRHG